MSQVNDIDVDIEYDNAAGKYKATVNYSTAHVKQVEFVRWTLKRKNNFPANARVIIQFVDQPTPPKTPVDGPFVGGDVAAGSYSTTGKHIYGIISTSANGSYYYTISYDDNGVVKELLDPEIIVDGNSVLFDRFLKGMSLALKALQQRDRLQGLVDGAKAKAAARPKKSKTAKRAKQAAKPAKRPAPKKR